MLESVGRDWKLDRLCKLVESSSISLRVLFGNTSPVITAIFVNLRLNWSTAAVFFGPLPTVGSTNLGLRVVLPERRLSLLA